MNAVVAEAHLLGEDDILLKVNLLLNIIPLSAAMAAW